MCSHLFPVFLIFPPVCPNCSWCSECVTCGRSPAAGPTQSTKKQSVLFTRFPVPCAFQIVCYLCAPYCLLGSQFPVCSRLYPVPYFSLLFSVCFECVPCVFRLFLVFRVCNLWEATSCRANTTYTETVSIVYSVPSSQFPVWSQLCRVFPLYSPVFLVFSVCYLPVCSLLFTLFPVSSVCPMLYGSPFSHIVLSMFRVCPLCDPHYSLCSQCVYTLCVPYVPSAFPNSPPVSSQLFLPLFPDCSLCYECVTCGRPPAVGPTLYLHRNSQYCLLGSQFPVCSKLCVTCVLPITYLVPSSQCVPKCVWFPIFPYCSQYDSSVFPIVSGVPSVVSIVPSVPY